MKLSKVENGFIINENNNSKFITYVEHSIRITYVPENIKNEELLLETTDFKCNIDNKKNQLVYGYVNNKLMIFTYDNYMRELSCSIDDKFYTIPVITKYQRWLDNYPGNHLRMYVESENYNYSLITNLEYVYYHGQKSAEDDPISILVLIPDNKFKEFVLYALNNGYKTAISKD